MKVIEKLTKAQEKQIPKYIDKWITQASKPMNHVSAKKYINKMYKAMGEEKPIIIIGNSPMNACLLALLFKNLIDKDNKANGSLRNQLSNQLDSQLRNQLYSQLSNQLDSQLSSQLYSQLDSQLYSQLDKINSDWYLSLWWLTWCGWYEYAKYIGVKFDKDKYDLFVGFVSEIHFIIPYKGVCFISEKPTQIHWSNKRLHKDLDLAVKYSDGYGLYCLNGITMPKDFVMTPVEEISVKDILKEKNADIRREMVRKIGVERIVEKLGATTLDKESGYELVNVNIGDNRVRPYLKMLNPSIGTWHIEGVSPSCNTVEEALAYRNSMKEYYPPMRLT